MQDDRHKKRPESCHHDIADHIPSFLIDDLHTMYPSTTMVSVLLTSVRDVCRRLSRERKEEFTQIWESSTLYLASLNPQKKSYFKAKNGNHR